MAVRQPRHKCTTRTPEAALVRLLCIAEYDRSARHSEIDALARISNPETLLGLLSRLDLVALAGTRLLESGVQVSDAFSGAVTAERNAQRQRGEALELVVFGLMSAFADAGVRALPIKGVALARHLYDDVGLRSTSDIDVLVGPQDLGDAVVVANQLGWTIRPRRSTALPLLHETLTHASLPALELHWRVHWYERQFAADALSRCERTHTHGPLRMRPMDELATLLLCFERDGFSGLRLASDITTWCSLNTPAQTDPNGLEALASAYPELAASLSTAARVMIDVLDAAMPMVHAQGFRSRFARRLSNPLLAGADSDIRAAVSLIDLLLAPPRGFWPWVSRELSRAPDSESGPARYRIYRRGTHLARVVPRWLVALSRAARTEIADTIRDLISQSKP